LVCFIGLGSRAKATSNLHNYHPKFLAAAALIPATECSGLGYFPLDLRRVIRGVDDETIAPFQVHLLILNLPRLLSLEEVN
jgi:hypothetical protein